MLEVKGLMSHSKFSFYGGVGRGIADAPETLEALALVTCKELWGFGPPQNCIVPAV